MLFDAKGIVYVGGGYLLVAGIDPAWLVSERVVKRVIIALTVLVGGAAALSLAHHAVPIHLPLVTSEGPALSADLSSVSTALALCLLGIEVCRRPVRRPLVGLCIFVLLCPLSGSQRAAIIEVAFGLLAFAVAGVTAARHRITVKKSDIAIVGGWLVALVIVFASYRLYLGDSINPLARNLNQTFNGIGKKQSAAARVSLRNQAFDLIRHRPLMGWGLGKQVLLTPLPPELPAEVPTHNLALDLLMRGGVVALGLFLFGVVRTLIDSWRAMLRQADPALVGLTLGASAAIVGFLAKSSVESLFDQFRLATMFGFMLGAVSLVSQRTSAGRVGHGRRIAEDSASQVTDEVQGAVSLSAGAGPSSGRTGASSHGSNSSRFRVQEPRAAAPGASLNGGGG